MIVKCLIPTCCKPFVTNWMTIFPKRFLPAPSIYNFGPNGLYAVEPSEYAKKPRDYKFASLKERLIGNLLPNEARNYNPPPYDLYCPSMMPYLAKFMCEICGLSCPCEAAKNNTKFAIKVAMKTKIQKTYQRKFLMNLVKFKMKVKIVQILVKFQLLKM